MKDLTEEQLNEMIRAWVDSLPQHSGKDDGLTPHQRLQNIIPVMDEMLDRADLVE